MIKWYSHQRIGRIADDKIEIRIFNGLMKFFEDDPQYLRQTVNFTALQGIQSCAMIFGHDPGLVFGAGGVGNESRVILIFINQSLAVFSLIIKHVAEDTHTVIIKISLGFMEQQPDIRRDYPRIHNLGMRMNLSLARLISIQLNLQE